MRTRDKVLASGAVWGPLAFIAAWIVGGVGTADYSAVDQAISQLAASGAATQGLMNAGLVGYGLGVGVAAIGLRHIVGRLAATSLGINALSTFGVLLTPLDVSESIDLRHTVFAGIAYAALAGAGISAGRHFFRAGRARWGTTSVVVGAVTGVSLLAVSFGTWTGFFQRLGLTLSDTWLMGLAVAVIAGSLTTDQHRAVN